MWAFAIVLGLGAILVGIVLARRRELRAIRNDAERYASKTFADLPALPTVEARWVYGYPAFQVRFRSQADLDAAKRQKLTAAYLDAIQNRCSRLGPRTGPFDASRAVWFTSPEERAGFRDSR
jgi:hypothetical protein